MAPSGRSLKPLFKRSPLQCVSAHLASLSSSNEGETPTFGPEEVQCEGYFRTSSTQERP